MCKCVADVSNNNLKELTTAKKHFSLNVTKNPIYSTKWVHFFTKCTHFVAGVEGIEPLAYGFGVIASQVVQTIDNSGKNSSYFIEIPL